MKSAIKISISILEYILLAAIFIAIVFVYVSNRQGEPFFVFDKSIVWVMSQSMEPEIPRQSYILVEKADPNEVAVGDVILFYSDDPTLAGNMNTHRVVEIVDGGKEFVTRGDNNLKNDDYTAKAEKVIAVYKGNLPWLTMVGRFMATPIGLIITIFSIFAVIFLLYYPDMKKAKKAWDARLAAEKQKEFEQRVQTEVERLRSENQKDTQQDTQDDKKNSN